MRTTIDRAGRIVVPKPLRDELGLSPGQHLELEARDGRLEIEPAVTPVTLVEEEGAVFAVPDRELPPLTAEQVRSTLERLRR
jgi:AbrB family looped-hinge helix DNA binding protein